MRNTDEGFIGYLAHYISPQKAYFGGLLVTDTKGTPKEFRHTEGVIPTKVQEMLYGDALATSIGSDAIAPALVNALMIKPDVLLIDQAGQPLFGRFAFLNPPSAMVAVYDDPAKNMTNFIAPEGNLLSGIPLELKGNSKEMLYVYMEDESQGSLKTLRVAEKRMNLSSPFLRIYNVLSEIAKLGKK
ncbi:MAG: hypothetical protein OHK0029_40310 [Armatimonadaceae bacterium]